MINIYSKKNTSAESGFAIATILLAVILIAVIISALAVASRGSVGNADREKAVLNQAMMSQTMLTIDHGVQRVITGGGDTTTLTMDSLVQDGYVPSAILQNGDILAYPAGSVIAGTMIAGQIRLGVTIDNGVSARIVQIYGFNDTSCNGLNQNTYDAARQNVLATTLFVPQFLNSQSRMASGTGYNIIFDDGIRRWIAGTINPSTIGTPDLTAMNPTMIPMFPGKPVCFRFFTNLVPQGYVNTVFMWNYD